MQEDISQLYRLGIIHPKVKKVIQNILCIPDYNKKNINQIYFEEIYKQYPPEYKFNQNFQQCINELLNYV